MSRATNQLIAEGFSRGLNNFVEGYTKRKAAEANQAILDNPESTPVQRAMALSSMGYDKVGAEVLKSSNKQANIMQIESGLQNDLAIARGEMPQEQQQEAPRDRSWRPDVSGRTPPIREVQQENTVQPGAEGTGSPTQPGFTPGSPQQAARNQTALNQQAPAAPPLRQPAPMMANAPQGQQQQAPDPLKEAAAYDNAARKAIETDPQLARFYENKSNQIRKDVRADKEIAAAKEIVANKEKVRIDTSHQKNYDKIIHDAEDAQSHLLASEKARDVITQGKVGNKGIAGLKRAFFKGSKWEDYFKNEDHALLEAAAIEDYSGMKSMFGGKISDADLKVVSSKVVSPYKSDEANIAIIDYRQFQDRMKIAKAEIADEIIAENGGYKPSDFNKQIRDRMGELYGQEAEQVIEKAVNEGRPSPKPSPQDPTMDSVYGKVPEGQIRLKKGSEVITIPAAYLQDALADKFIQLGGP
jgi:uncharacterized protein YdaU (DUF1376 family)